MRQRQRRSRLIPQIELLETRLAPDGSPWLLETFDTTPTGSIPPGWSQWSTHTGASFQASSTLALSPTRGFSSVVPLSSTSSRSWVNTAVAADVQVTSAMHLGTLIPMQVLVRGKNLNTTAPSYYAVSVTRGMKVELQRVVNGTRTILATLNSAGYFSGQWVRVRLSAIGDQLQIQLQRTDTGAYLNSSGNWQTAATNAMSVTDTVIQSGGQVGLARQGSYSGTITFDDFRVDLPVPPEIVESFDTTPPGSLPTGWVQWINSGTVAFQVSATKPLTGATGLRSRAVSATATSRTWPVGLQLADAQVSASLFLDSLAPGGLLLRGKNLNATTGSYYALQATRGLNLDLVKVINGVTTNLGSVVSKSYFSGHWVKLTLYANGSNLRGQVFRPDTGQYLAPDGTWQNGLVWAINVTDTALSVAGFAGIERPARHAGSLYWDEFAFLSATGDNLAPSVTITAPSGNQTLSGVIPVAASVSDNVGVIRVEFYVDNVLQSSQTMAPFVWDFDTSTATNGNHTIEVLAYDVAGNVGEGIRPVMTQNDDTVSRPDFPRHYSHIRIAQLAYTGTPFGAIENQLLTNSVDLVISAQANLAHLNAVAPNTPRLLYTNVSNLYEGLLTDWLSYADKNDLARESAFYHAAQATPFFGNSPSSQPVRWFWSVLRDGTTWSNLTSMARGTNPGGVSFGQAGQSIYIGYPDRFREINFAMQSPAGSGWSAVLEYPTAVDSNGKPTAWATLTPLTNGTLGLTQSGQVLFDPPANWKAASVNGSAPLFFVRYRTVTGGTAPTATTILGRDFVNANGGHSGIIPSFDPQADANHDGYLNNSEYGNRTVGKDARFFYESRLFHGSYGQMRFSVNPAPLGVRDWASDYHVKVMATYPLASGVFADNSAGTLPISPGSALEPTASYSNDFGALLNAVARAIAPRWVLANTVGGGTQAESVIRRIQGYYEEFLIRPLAHNTRQFEDVAGMIGRRTPLRTPSPYAVIDSYPTGGSPTDPRTQLATLAYYYLLADPVSTFLNFYGGFEPATTWSRHWAPAAAFDVGQPAANWSVFASGSDPTNAALTYKIYQRSYTKALVLYKPLSYGNNVNGTLADSTATTHTLPGSYRKLNADGTLGGVITSVSLRNGEGAILIKTTP